MVPVGFWRRVVAALVDDVLLMCLIWGLYQLSRGLFFEEVAVPLVQWLAFLLRWAYYALMESSDYQATLGKFLIGAKVTDLDGNRITFGRATGRYFAKILSQAIFAIGFLMVAFTHNKRGMHDHLAGTLVIEAWQSPVVPPTLRRP